MPKAALAADSEGDPALVEAMLRGRKSTAALYWRFRRPPASSYAIAVGLLVAYRLAAVVLTIIALAFFTFGGLVAGGIGNSRWAELADAGKGTDRKSVV